MRKAASASSSGFRDEETGRRAPYSPQERWENQSGYSPNSIAAQIAGLVCAADIARKNGDRASRASGSTTRRPVAAKVKRLDASRPNGPLSGRPYYLRLTKNGEPDTASPYEHGRRRPDGIDQRAVVDPSFLDLVRLGLRPAGRPRDR